MARRRFRSAQRDFVPDDVDSAFCNLRGLLKQWVSIWYALIFVEGKRSQKSKWGVLFPRLSFLSYFFRYDKLLALASAQGNSGVDAVASQMKRLFGPLSGAVRQVAMFWRRRTRK